jgi:GNAT superfamily N-acetyltransferase
MSYTDLPDGELAAVVTFLEMRKPPEARFPSSALSLRPIADPEIDEYRRLFRRIGGHWLWFSRLVMSDEELARIIKDPAVDLHIVVDELGTDIGMLELDFREDGQCEIAFIGLLPELAGRGHGRWLLGQTLGLAWRDGVKRVHVHTCTLDHPAALSAYRSAGFTAYKRAFERFPDPRLNGILPRDVAPQVPLLGTPAAEASRPAS